MSQNAKDLDALVEEIESAHADARLEFEARLARLIEDMEANGDVVPAAAKDLHDDLVNEKIEAQFDNLPV
jgi:polyhydroxyalkanoate synthesis regulator phasin